MDIEEIRQLNSEELRAKRLELKEELSALRMQKSVTTLENPMRLRNVRRSVARINTVLRERDMKESENNE